MSVITSSSPSSDNAKPVIFIVDDDESVLKSLKIILSRKYAVRTESRARTAVEAIKDLLPDVVVVDLKMPVHDGFWTFSEIRKFNADVPIIINSAYQDILPPEDLRDTFRPFANVQKGGSLATFMNVISEAAESVLRRKLRTL